MFELPIRLEGLNEYQNACRRHPLAGAQMKKNAIKKVLVYLTPVTPLEWPVQFDIYYAEPNAKRDIDNVTGFGAKVILDAFVKAGFLPDDGPDYVNKLDQTVLVDKDNPNILIYVKEKGDPNYFPMYTNEDAFMVADIMANELNMEKKNESVSKRVRNRKC